MTRFADAFYFLALLNHRDAAHAAAIRESRGPDAILTTEWILTELADAQAPASSRGRFVALHDILSNDPQVTVVASDPDLFARAVQLYADRPDKDWSLTDCLSFVVMKDHQVTDALTADRHFEQAGFTALLRRDP